MPLMDFDPANRFEVGTDYQKLKLKLGESARILGVDPAPTFCYTHTLRAPKIENGRGVRETKTRKDKSTFDDWVKVFVGQPQCLGDIGILRDKGSDPRNCPACEKAQESGDVEGAKARFAMHVIKYSTNPGGWNLRTPYGADIMVWAFSAKVYDKLNSIANEYGGLRNIDLKLGPCEDEGWQRYDIMPAREAAWQHSDELKNLVVANYRDNRYPGNLEDFCGRKVERSWMLNDLQRITDDWRRVRAAAEARVNGTYHPNDGTEQTMVNHGLAVGLDGLDAAQPASNGGRPAWLASPEEADAVVAQQQAAQRPAVTSSAVVPNFDDLLGPGTAPAETAQPVSAAPAAAAPVSAAPAPAPAPAPKPTAISAIVGELSDFDAMLNSVGG